MIAPPRIRPVTSYRSPVLTRSRSAMAQFAGEPLISVALEGISTSVPLTLASTPSVPLVAPGFHPLVLGAPQHAAGALADLLPSRSGH